MKITAKDPNTLMDLQTSDLIQALHDAEAFVQTARMEILDRSADDPDLRQYLRFNWGALRRDTRAYTKAQ